MKNFCKLNDYVMILEIEPERVFEIVKNNKSVTLYGWNNVIEEATIIKEVISYDNSYSGGYNCMMYEGYTKKFKKIGIKVDIDVKYNYDKETNTFYSTKIDEDIDEVLNRFINLRFGDKGVNKNDKK